MAPKSTKAPASAPKQQSLAPAVTSGGELDAVTTPIVQALNELTNEASKVTSLLDRGRELHKQFDGVAFNCSTSKGMAQAVEARKLIRMESRYPLQTLQKDVSKQLGTMQRQWNDTLAAYCAEIEKYEKPIDDQITAQERMEKERIAALEARIRDIQATPDKAIGKDIATLAEIIAALKEQGDPESLAEFQEYREAAAGAIEQALSKVNALHKQAVDAEEGRKALEEQRRDQVRKDAIRTRIFAISDFLGQVTLCRTSARVQELIDRLTGIAIDPSFAEFSEEAQAEKSRVLQQLAVVRDEKKEAEDTRAALAAAQAAAPAPAPVARTPDPVRDTLRELPVVGTLHSEGGAGSGRFTFEPKGPAAETPERGDYLPRDQSVDTAPAREADVAVERPTDAEILSVLVEHYDSDARTVAAWLRAFDADTALAQHALAM